MALAPVVLPDFPDTRQERGVKAVRVHATGDAGVLRVDEVPVPQPGPGQALVRVEAAGLNFIEIYHRTGLYKIPLPAILGSEGAGTVEVVGPGVSTVLAGDRVASVNLLGSYAEYALAAADRLLPIPDGVSSQQAAAVMLQGMTAHYLT